MVDVVKNESVNSENKKYSKKAILSLFFVIFGPLFSYLAFIIFPVIGIFLILPFFELLGLILGIISLIEIRRKNNLKGKVISIISIILAMLFMVVVCWYTFNSINVAYID
jgi:hypothetical protein